MAAQLEVDVTGWTIAQLVAGLASQVDSDTPADLEDQLPFVTVARGGGGDDNMAIDAATMLFHCFAATEQAANQLGQQIRVFLRDLRGTVADGGVLTQSRKIGGPIRVPSENPAVKHAVLTMQLQVKTA